MEPYLATSEDIISKMTKNVRWQAVPSCQRVVAIVPAITVKIGAHANTLDVQGKCIINEQDSAHHIIISLDLLKKQMDLLS